VLALLRRGRPLPARAMMAELRSRVIAPDIGGCRVETRPRIHRAVRGCPARPGASWRSDDRQPPRLGRTGCAPARSPRTHTSGRNVQARAPADTTCSGANASTRHAAGARCPAGRGAHRSWTMATRVERAGGPSRGTSTGRPRTALRPRSGEHRGYRLQLDAIRRRSSTDPTRRTGRSPLVGRPARPVSDQAGDRGLVQAGPRPLRRSGRSVRSATARLVAERSAGRPVRAAKRLDDAPSFGAPNAAWT